MHRLVKLILLHTAHQVAKTIVPHGEAPNITPVSKRNIIHTVHFNAISVPKDSHICCLVINSITIFLGVTGSFIGFSI